MGPLSRLGRITTVALGAAVLVLAIGGEGLAADGGGANGGQTLAPRLSNTLATAAGSQLQLVAVAPCRIIDTRKAGGPVLKTKRTFVATGSSYAAQGGSPVGCGVPAGVAAVQINVGALSYAGGVGWVKGWATGATEPTASLVNYDKTGPVANMVTLPVNASGQFQLRTNSKAHFYVDIAGYYVKPLYAAVRTDGTIYNNIASGVVSATRVSTGVFRVTFDRDVTHCGAATNDLIFASTRDVSADNTYGGNVLGNPNTVQIEVTDGSSSLVDTIFSIVLTC